MIDAGPRPAEASRLLGLIAHQAGRDVEALECLRRAVDADPGVAVNRRNLAAVLGRAVRLRPDHPETLNNLGVALETLGH